MPLSMIQPVILDHVLFVLFGLLLPANSVFRSQPRLGLVDKWDTHIKKAVYQGNSLFLWAIAVVVVMSWQFLGRPLSGLGFRWPEPGSWGPGLLISIVFLIAYGLDVWSEVSSPEALARTRRHWRKHTPFMPENQYELRQFMLVAVSAAVCEEILFRGYFITYLLAVFGDSLMGKTLAVVIPTIIFALSHYYQGWKAVGKIALLSLAFGLIFIITKSLFLPIMLHLVVDVMGGWLSLIILKENEPGPTPANDNESPANEEE